MSIYAFIMILSVQKLKCLYNFIFLKKWSELQGQRKKI